jgi:DEAD/DEAH box helicase domain-containing protein
MELLAQYLENPDAERLFAAHAKAYAFSLLDPSNIANSVTYADWRLNMEEIQEALGVEVPAFEFRKSIYGTWKPRTSNPHMTVYSGVVYDDMQKNKFQASASVYATLDDKEESRTDKYEQEWNGFWQFFNVMQFLREFGAVSEVGLRNMVYSLIPAATQQSVAAETGTTISRGGWGKDILEQVFDESVRTFASRCVELDVVQPDFAGYELVSDSGSVIGEAELAWERFKVALLTPEQEESKDSFISEGWTVISPEDEIQPVWFKES